MTTQYVIQSTSTALVAATAKTAIVLSTTANVPCEWIGLDVTFDGVNASAVPVLVELCTFTGSGTGTAATPARAGQAVGVAQTTAKNTLTVEPAGAASVVSWLVPPTSGLFYLWPLGREFFMNVSTFQGVRLTAPAAVNCRVNLTIEE